MQENKIDKNNDVNIALEIKYNSIKHKAPVEYSIILKEKLAPSLLCRLYKNLSVRFLFNRNRDIGLITKWLFNK